MSSSRSEGGDLETTELHADSLLADHAEIFALWDGGQLSRPLVTPCEVVVGRGTEANVLIDHVSLSRRHIIVHVRDHRIEIEELGSANGTRVRGKALASGERATIEWGEAVEVGAVILVVRPPAPRSVHTTNDESAVVAPQLPELDADANAALLGTNAPAVPAEMEKWIELVANTDMSVLLLGETGVGKGYYARKIHERSHRNRGPLLHINCAALPENLLESELFGYERGAFTGAQKAKPGLLESASGGTVFLDEIGELPASTQAKLLVAIEHREVLRVGGLSPRPFDVRFIAATNRDLAALSEQGTFRADLYFRLAGLPIEVPPLRDRLAEIPTLAETFVREASTKLGRAKPPRLSQRAHAALSRHRWPGNVRELMTVLERSVLLGQNTDEIDAHHVEAALAPSRTLQSAPRSSKDKEPASEKSPPSSNNDERSRILAALEECGGNQSRAAQRLGISRRTLIHRIESFGLPRPRRG